MPKRAQFANWYTHRQATACTAWEANMDIHTPSARPRSLCPKYTANGNRTSQIEEPVTKSVSSVS